MFAAAHFRHGIEVHLHSRRLRRHPFRIPLPPLAGETDFAAVLLRGVVCSVFGRFACSTSFQWPKALPVREVSRKAPVQRSSRLRGATARILCRPCTLIRSVKGMWRARSVILWAQEDLK